MQLTSAIAAAAPASPPESPRHRTAGWRLAPRRPATRASRSTRSSAATASVVAFEPAKIAIAMTKAFLAVNGGQGAASARVRERSTKLTDAVVARADAAQARGRHLPHRGHPGPGRAGADARRRARGRARLRAVPRAARAGARARQGAGKGAGRRARRSPSSTTACACRSTSARLTRAGRRIAAPAWADVDAEPHPRGDAEGPVRRRADGRGAQVRRSSPRAR